MYVSNPGNLSRSDEVCVIIRVQSGGQGFSLGEEHTFWGVFGGPVVDEMQVGLGVM
jgi:hypothetical protein